MGLKDILQQYVPESGSSNNVDPRSQLKNDIIIAKNQETFTFRMVQPVNDSLESVLKTFRRIFLNPTKNGTRTKSLVFKAEDINGSTDPNDPLVQAVSDWRSKGVVPNKWANGFSKVNYLQVIPVDFDNQGQPYNRIDQQTGLPDVTVYECPSSVTDGIMKALESPENDPENNRYYQAMLNDMNADPNNQNGWSFISANIAFPITVTYDKNEKTPSNKYSVSVGSSPLSPLPAGWENALEDLNALTVPSSQENPTMVTNYITDMNAEINAELNNGGQTQPTQSRPQSQQGYQPRQQPQGYNPSQARPQGQRPTQGQNNPYQQSQPTNFQPAPQRPQVQPASGSNGNRGNYTQQPQQGASRPAQTQPAPQNGYSTPQAGQRVANPSRTNVNGLAPKSNNQAPSQPQGQPQAPTSTGTGFGNQDDLFKDTGTDDSIDISDSDLPF